MVSQTLERITALSRMSSYDKAAWTLMAALIAVLAVLWNCSSIAGHFAAEPSSLNCTEDYIVLGAFVAEMIIFVLTFIVLARASHYTHKKTRTVAMLTYFGCFTLGAITLIAIGLTDIHYNCWLL